MVEGTGPKHGGKTDRQLKELRSLMPWNWDSRVEEHPPGEKAMQDFEDVVNYRIDGRKRRHVHVAPETKEKKGKKKAAKAKGVDAEEDIEESNKENIPPTGLIIPVVEEEAKSDVLCTSAKEENAETAVHPVVVASPCKSLPTATPKPPAKEHVVTAAPVTPGFLLTPAMDNVLSSQKKKKKKPQGRPSKLSGCEKNRVCSETAVKKKQARKVTFCQNVDESNDSPINTARVVNFSATVFIDPKKYGNGIRVKRPASCPPLFRTLDMHGRTVIPTNPTNLHSVFREPQGKNVQPRVNTPYKGTHSQGPSSRSSILSEVIQHGIKLREAAQRPAVIPPYKPLELSPKLSWAVSQL